LKVSVIRCFVVSDNRKDEDEVAEAEAEADLEITEIK
jgi:hypothetical protein